MARWAHGFNTRDCRALNSIHLGFPFYAAHVAAANVHVGANSVKTPSTAVIRLGHGGRTVCAYGVKHCGFKCDKQLVPPFKNLHFINLNMVYSLGKC